MRQSFWSTRRAAPSLTTSAESPPGPSVIDVSVWMATVSPSPRSSSSPSIGAHEVGEAERAQPLVELAGRVAGDEDRDVACEVLGQPHLVEVVAVEVGDVEEVGAPRCARRSVRRRGDRCAGTRTTSRGTPARTTGRTGSMPCSVSISRPACPSDVTRISPVVPVVRRRVSGAVRRRAGRWTADRRATRARSTRCRPSSAARSGRPDRRTTRPAPTASAVAAGCVVGGAAARHPSTRRRPSPTTRRCPPSPDDEPPPAAPLAAAGRPAGTARRTPTLRPACPPALGSVPAASGGSRRRGRHRDDAVDAAVPTESRAQEGDDLRSGGDDRDHVPAVGRPAR